VVIGEDAWLLELAVATELLEVAATELLEVARLLELAAAATELLEFAAATELLEVARLLELAAAATELLEFAAATELLEARLLELVTIGSLERLLLELIITDWLSLELMPCCPLGLELPSSGAEGTLEEQSAKAKSIERKRKHTRPFLDF